METSVKAFQKICRVCLKECRNMTPLLYKTKDGERNLFEVLAFTTNMNVHFDDNLPKQVCRECQDVMCKADAFKRRCLESEKILKNLCQLIGTGDESSNIVKECAIKHENPDITHQSSNHVSFQPSSAANHATEVSIDKKNILLQEITIYPTVEASFSLNSDSIVLDNSEQPVKEEVVIAHEEEIEYSDHYDDADDNTTANEGVTVEKLVECSKKIFVCNCGQTFNSKNELDTHSKTHKTKKVSRNEYKQKFVTIKLQDGVQTLDEMFKCTLCLCIFKDEELFFSHKHDIIPDSKLFQCSLCLRRFKNKTFLESHLEKHKERDSVRHVCDICNRQFRYKGFLENHILTNHLKVGEKRVTARTKAEKKHPCSVCGKGFSMSCTLREHMRTHTGEKPYLCSQCGRGFSQRTNLVQHMRRHQGLKPFKCDICEARFVSNGELESHSRKHSGDHPFMCDDCGNGFTTSSALVKHRRTHTGEKPYLCDLCPMKFAASGTLKNHRRTHTGERPFQCSYCEKAFVQRNDLISHIRCHTGEKPYTCTQCGQAFRKPAGLKNHIRMHAKEPGNTGGAGVMMNEMRCAEQ